MRRHAFWGVLVVLGLLVPLALLLLSCGGGGGSSSTGGTSPGTTGTGSVAVLLADGPADEYDHIYIWVTEVSLIPAAGSAAPVTIFQTNENDEGHRGHKVDLLEYQDEDFVLTVKKGVPAGKYAKIRLEISHIETEGGDCDDNWVKLPSGKIDLNPREPFFVSQGGTLSIRLDIDANKSINLHPAGKSGKCIFRPVVFVDIEEGAPLERCPKVVSGTIASLRYNDTNQVVGFVLDLQGDRGTLEVSLSDTTSIFNEDLLCMTRGDLDQYQNAQAKVRGRLNNNGVFNASLVVIGELLDVTGTVTSLLSINPNAQSAFSFTFQPSGNQELGGEWQVTGQRCTLVLVGCDTLVDPSKIQQGMPVRIFGKAFSPGGLRAAAVVLQDQEVSGTILTVADERNGKTITIDENGSSVQVFVGITTPIYLEGDGTVGLEQLCTGQEVRVLLKSLATPFEAALVQVESVRHAGLVTKVTPGVLEVSLTEGGTGTETVYVQPGATILKSEEDDDKQELVPFNQIKVGDSIVYFGLPVCQASSKFNAFVVVIVHGQDSEDDDFDDGDDGDDDD